MDKNQNVSQTIFEAITNFFTEDNWYFVEIEKNKTVCSPFQGRNGKLNCYAQAKEAEQQFVFYSIFPIKVQENQRQNIAEFIARANYGMIIGNFELDFHDGELRYKTSNYVTRNKLSFELIKILVYTNVKITDEYLPGIMSIINDNVSPELAIYQIEQNQEINNSLNNLLASLQEDLTSNISCQTDLQPQQKIIHQEPHILTMLTPEEIGQFHQALQVMPHYQRKKSEAIIEKLQKELIDRLGESGLTIFTQVFNFFREVKIEIKNIKLIQRYSGIAGQTNLLLQYLSNESEEDKKKITPITDFIEKISDLFWSINNRLQELSTNTLEGEKEFELLVEIEEFRSQLSTFEKLIKNSE
jgi:hypothetical protein